VRWHREYFWPLVLVVIGVYFLLNNLGLLDWLQFGIVWPVLLILLGAWLIIRRQRQ
jgi:phage shock protein C